MPARTGCCQPCGAHIPFSSTELNGITVWPTAQRPNFRWNSTLTPARLVSTDVASAAMTLQAKSRTGRQDLQVVCGLAQNAADNAVRSGMYIANGWALWIEWSDNTIRYAPTDGYGTMNLPMSTVIYTYGSTPSVVNAIIGVFENVLGHWNLFFSHDQAALITNQWDAVLWNQSAALWSSSGALTFGVAGAANGGGWTQLIYNCYVQSCTTCDDGTPQTYQLTVPFTSGEAPGVYPLSQARADGTGWIAIGDCGVDACVFGLGSQSLPPITPVTPNPIVDFAQIDSAIGARPQLVKWPFNNRESWDYAFIEDSAIHWALIVGQEPPFGGVGIGAYSQQSVFVAAIARGQFGLPIWGGTWTVPIHFDGTTYPVPTGDGGFITEAIPALDFTMTVTSSSSGVVYPGTFDGSSTITVTGSLGHAYTFNFELTSNSPPSLPFHMPGWANLTWLMETGSVGHGIGPGVIGVFYPLGSPWFAIGGANVYTTGVGDGSFFGDIDGIPPGPSTLTFTGVDVANYVNFFGANNVGDLLLDNPLNQFESVVALYQISYADWCCYGANMLSRIKPDVDLPNAWPADLSTLFSVPLTSANPGAGGTTWNEYGSDGVTGGIQIGSSQHYQDGTADHAYSGYWIPCEMGALVELISWYPQGYAFYSTTSIPPIGGTGTLTRLYSGGMYTAGPNVWDATIPFVRNADGSVTIYPAVPALSVTFRAATCLSRWNAGVLLSQDPAGSNFPATVQVQAVLPSTFSPPCEIECIFQSQDAVTWVQVQLTGEALTPCPSGTTCNQPPFKPRYAGQYAYTFCE